MARTKIRESNGMKDGDGMASRGSCSVRFVAIVVVVIIAVIAVGVSAS